MFCSIFSRSCVLYPFSIKLKSLPTSGNVAAFDLNNRTERWSHPLPHN